jgi:dTDP-4-amino-4,6-dideoxygalactose transaminase
LPRAKFLKALAAEGIPASGGYSPLNKDTVLTKTLASKAYRRVYPSLALADWQARNACPENDRLCEEAIWLTQNMLLAGRADMEQIAEAVRKIQAHAGDMVKAG